MPAGRAAPAAYVCPTWLIPLCTRPNAAITARPRGVHHEFIALDLRYAQDSIPQTRTLHASPRKQRSVHLASQGRVMTSFRAVRIGLDYFASLQGRKHAQELCLLYGRGPL